MRNIICIAGLIGSGKDEAARHIVKTYGYVGIDYSEMLRAICRREGLAVTRDNLQNLRVKYGNLFLAEAVVAEVKKTRHHNVLLNGLRRSEDYDLPKKEFGTAVHMIVISAPPRIRFARVKERKRENDPQDFAEFERQERREFSIYDFETLFSHANWTIENTGSILDLHHKLDAIMKTIMGAPHA